MIDKINVKTNRVKTAFWFWTFSECKGVIKRSKPSLKAHWKIPTVFRLKIGQSAESIDFNIEQFQHQVQARWIL